MSKGRRQRRAAGRLARQKRRLRRAMFAVLLALVGVHLLDAPVLQQVRHRAFDALQQIRPAAYPDALPVRIVAIDERSLAELGQWPWPRTRLAELVQRLRAQGAALIGFNIVFPDADRLSGERLAESLDLPPALRATLAERPSNDRVFAETLAAAPTVLGVGLSDAPAGADDRTFLYPPVVQIGDPGGPGLAAFEKVVPAVWPLHTGATSAGVVHFGLERDGVVRRIPAAVRAGGQLVPAMPVELVRLALGAPATILNAGPGGFEGLRLGRLTVPVDRSANLWLRYTAHAPARFVSAADALAGRVPPERVRGHVVIIGATASGLVDLRATPLTPAMSAVEIQAQVVENLLAQRALTRLPDFTLIEAATALVLGTVLVFVVARLLILPACLAAGLIVAVPLAGMWLGYARGGLLLDGAYPALALLVVFACQATAGFALEERSKRRIRQAFGQYISPVLVDQLTRAGTTPETGGDERPITVMFCDVRGFTAISEGFAGDPAGLTRLMNRYLTAVTDVVMAHGGTIDKYIGDAVMAFWNAPLDDPDHAANAVRAALAIEARIIELNDELRAEVAAQDGASAATGGAGLRRSVDPPRFRVGIGINTGRCLVGNLGSAQRFNYSALGDAVNVAARLEGETKTYSTTILAGETTVRHGRAAALFLERRRLRGREEPVGVYAVLGDEAMASSPDFKRLLADHASVTDALERYDSAGGLAAIARCEALSLAPTGLYAGLRKRLERPAPTHAGHRLSRDAIV